jgi:hypothetical protein
MSDDNVVVLDMETRLDIPPNRVLEGALNKLKTVVVIGYTEDDEVYLASSTGTKETIYYLAALAQKAAIED